jgi:transposase InsO family protein
MVAPLKFRNLGGRVARGGLKRGEEDCREGRVFAWRLGRRWRAKKKEAGKAYESWGTRDYSTGLEWNGVLSHVFAEGR